MSPHTTTTYTIELNTSIWPFLGDLAKYLAIPLNNIKWNEGSVKLCAHNENG